MKKINIKILGFLSLFIAAATFSACEREKESEDISKITYFADMKMTGSPEIFLSVGASFSDPGLKAFENGAEIPVTTVITGDFFPSASLDVNNPNKYLISYKATNKDGFDGTAERTVYVVSTGDMVSSIEGLYTSTVVRNGASGPQYTDMAYLMIRKVGTDKYEITDAIGGYYDLGRAYGATYRASGVIIVNNGGSYSAETTDFGVGAFGGVANITSFTVNAAAKSINFSTDWDAGYVFDVTLTQVQL